MRYAALMRYGGELGEASDCDYDDFRKLIPLCPNCKEPVFLRKASDRHLKSGKVAKVPAYWCHFAAVDQEQAAECEARVNAYSDKERAKILSSARGQRQRLIQRWAWFLFDKYVFDGDLGKYDENATIEVVQEAMESMSPGILEEIRKASDQELQDHVDMILRSFLDGEQEVLVIDSIGAKEKWRQGASESDVEKAIYRMDGKSKIEEDGWWHAIDPGLDREFHKKVAIEVYRFVCSRRQILLLSCLLLPCIGSTQLSPIFGSAPAEIFEDMINKATVPTVLQSILAVPWREELDNLGATSADSPAPSATHS